VTGRPVDGAPPARKTKSKTNPNAQNPKVKTQFHSSPNPSPLRWFWVFLFPSLWICFEFRVSDFGFASRLLHRKQPHPGGFTMIAFLHGKLVEALPTQVMVDVQGIGYEALIPLSSYDKLPQPGQEVKLLTHLAIREDAHTLYGFMTSAERDLFRLLINTVSGIGPKIALNVLSGISVTAFRGAVANSDVKALSQISGVGRKTAERIVVELKDKIGAAGAWEAASAQRALSPEDQKLNDAVLALMALGFKQIEAHDSVRRVQGALGPQATVEDLVRACLKKNG
jgi:Holliday junction DNA helicase RuvA